MSTPSDGRSAEAMSAGEASHLARFKARSRGVMDQEARRRIALERQKKDRTSRMNVRRLLTEEANAEPLDEAAGAGKGQSSSMPERVAGLRVLTCSMTPEPSEAALTPCLREIQEIGAVAVGDAAHGQQRRSVMLLILLVRPEFTLLDAVYVESQHAYYILDALQWKEMPLIETDFACRTFWLQSRFLELQVRPTVGKFILITAISQLMTIAFVALGHRRSRQTMFKPHERRHCTYCRVLRRVKQPWPLSGKIPHEPGQLQLSYSFTT
ncbi:uncharacterized protein MONBRDRAFT_12057, partial [Monosiga brevicollis MX1]